MRAHESLQLGVSYWLTALVAAAMSVVSAGGAFAPGLYRDNPLIAATFRGQDVVTLFVAVPLLVLGLVLEVRGSSRGRVLWLAMLFYALYSYLFYAVGAAFNVFFLLYVAIVGLALYALLSSVPRLVLEPAGTRVAARVVGVAYLLVVATGLAVLWTAMSLGYLFTGVVPAPIVASGHPTGVVFAIDLVFLVPPMVLGAIGLLRRRAFGGFLAQVMCLTGTVYTLGLAAAGIAVRAAGRGTGDEVPLWVALTLFGAVATALLVGRRSTGDAGRRPAR
ncbi:MAG TPA: hypothetical protein VK903_12690 [Propionicimonas sp.]|nr:hypothetical protein [Propionicimonas sp.]